MDNNIINKTLLTINEASKYYGIGIHKLRELTDEENCKFVLYIGRRRMLKKSEFDNFIKQTYS